MTSIMSRALSLIVASVVASGWVAPAAAQSDFPSRAIKIICAVPAGGGVDVTARVLADQLQRRWSQPVTVENRTGGGGNIGAEAVAVSPPDGYTLLATAPGPLAANATLFKKLSYDPSALIPVAIMAFSANVLAVKATLPVKSVANLIAHAKANPGKTSFASQGNGSTSHLTAALFQQRTDTKLTHVPYRGTAPALNDLAGGHVDMMFVDLGSVLPMHLSGKVRIIAVATSERLPAVPQIPPVADTVPNFTSSTWYALAAPPKTPTAVVTKLNQAISEIQAAPDVKERYQSMHITGSALDVGKVAAFIKSESTLWGGVIRAANITVD
jgi:tripartite-type tricarboxylate transporter receptor subunit TctC